MLPVTWNGPARLLLAAAPVLGACAAAAPRAEDAWRPGYEDVTPEHPERAAAPRRKTAAEMEVHEQKPPRAEAMSPVVEVRCPDETQTRSRWSHKTSRGAWRRGPSEGGCTYAQALARAKARAAERWADGIYGVEVTVGGNGKIVLLIATPYQRRPEPAEVKEASPEPGQTPLMTTREQRLKELLELREKGLITPADYERRRSQIVDEL